MHRALFRFVAISIAAPCCGPDARPPDCSNEPDFILEITAEDGTLPADTEIAVEYGGGSKETYTLDVEPESRRIMFCMPHSAGGGAGTAPASNAGAGGDTTGGGGDGVADGGATTTLATRLECELWTQGPAIVEITGGDYPLLHEDLKLARDECTLSVDLMLTHDEPTE